MSNKNNNLISPPPLKLKHNKVFQNCILCTETLNNSCKTAFTLAEVLITLGIIGVVAAMTLPGIIQNYQKHVVETKLKRIYAVMNEAVRLSEVKYGDKKYWETNLSPMEFYNKYYKGVLKVTSVKEIPDDNDEGILISFADGSILRSYRQGRDYDYFISADKYMKHKDKIRPGVDKFMFRLSPTDQTDLTNTAPHYNRGFEPYAYLWDGTRDGLIEGRTAGESYGCRQSARDRYYCAKLIQLNGWKIPDDYPFKF